MFSGVSWVVILVSISWIHQVTYANQDQEIACPLACKCTANQVDCTRAGLEQIPANLNYNVTTLLLGWNRLTKITLDSLQNYPYLKTLVLNHNEIYTVEGEFEHDRLENLDLAYNSVKDLTFLPKFPRLRHLNLSNNDISELDNSTFSSNGKLLSLVIHNNPVQRLDEGTFRKNNMLAILSIAGLEIDTLPAKLLDPLTRLQRLEIRNNSNLNQLRDEVFYYLGNLRYLDMSYNNLSSLPRSMRHLEALRNLNLDGNAFTCDCKLFWFANWLEKRPSIATSNGMLCHDTGSALIESLWRLHCSAVRLEMSTLFQQAPLGDPIILTCNFSGTPTPNVTWVTPDRKILRFPNSVSSQENDVTLISENQLKVDQLTRTTAGSYACHASNALSNVTAFMRIQITPKGFRRVQIHSVITGFVCVGAFVLITLIVQGTRHLMNRFGWWEWCYCCGKQLSPRAKQLRNLLEAIEQYKSQQLERLRENYNGQVHRIRDNCVQQMERIHQGYLGQVKYIRGVRSAGTQHLTTIREQYNDQAKRVYDYTMDRLQTVQRNYVTQRSRVRKFSAHQLIRMREKYKFQQRTLNKIMENLPAFYLDSCRSATCARTDSVYFQDPEVDVNIDVVESIIKQGIQLDLPDDVVMEVEGLAVLDGEELDLNIAQVPEELAELGPRKKGHGRQPSTGSFDFSFLFPPVRFPSLNWRRRNTVDEEPQEEPPTELKVAVEICPVPAEESAEPANPRPATSDL